MEPGASKRALSYFVVVATCLFCFSISVSAQTTPNNNPPSSNFPARPPQKTSDPMGPEKTSPSDDGPPLTTFEEEMRAKRMIKLAEKEHQQNVERAREISQLAKDLQQGFKTKSTLDREDVKRLDRLEKLTKKIRGEAGGEANEVQIVNSPTDRSSAVTQIAEVAESLSKSVQNTPRQVVSASVIDNANVLLELVRILRTFSQ
jgi:hypothetical protein